MTLKSAKIMLSTLKIRNNALNIKSVEKMPSMLKIKEFNVDGIISVDLTSTALNSLIFNIDSIISADFNVDDVKNQRI